jgi:hypothetical protein
MPAGGGRRHLIIHYMVPALLPIQLRRNAGTRKEQSKERAGDRAGAGERAKYRPQHRTETAPARLYNNLMLAYRIDDVFAVLAKHRIAQDLSLRWS